MPRIRSVKPEFWTDEKIVDLSPVAKLLYIGIWNFADDDGYIADSIRQLQLKIFPGSDYDVASARAELVKACVVLEMTSEQGDVLHVPRFRNHQSPKNPTHTRFTGLTARKGDSSTPALPQRSGNAIGGVGVGVGGNRKGIGASPVTESDFDSAWSHWPKKTERKKSLDKFRAVAHARGVDAISADVVKFGDAYRATTETRYVPALVVWLNGERWTDDLPTGGPSGKKQPPDKEWMNR